MFKSLHSEAERKPLAWNFCMSVQFGISWDEWAALAPCFGESSQSSVEGFPWLCTRLESAANPHLECQENFKVFHKNNDIVTDSLVEFVNKIIPDLQNLAGCW